MIFCVHGLQHERQELHEIQLAQLKDCFELMDSDKGGSIDEDELKESFKLLGIKMSRAEAKAMFDEVDEDGSGAVRLSTMRAVVLFRFCVSASSPRSRRSSRES